MNKLENKYTWEEIGELFADRIEKTKFIEEGYKRHDFLRWFNEKKDIGIRFDWRLVARAYVIWLSLQKEHDHFTVIVGEEGQGKSTFALQLCSWISPNMKLDDLVFDMDHYLKKLDTITKYYKRDKENKVNRSVIIDEGGISLFSREALSKSNKTLAKTFMVQRFLNVHVCICIPYYWGLDTLIRNHRINTLIVITKRGEYKAYTGMGIKILNKLGMKNKEKPLKAIPIPYGMFWDGRFHKSFPKNISKLRYERHKFKHIKNFLKSTKPTQVKKADSETS